MNGKWIIIPRYLGSAKKLMIMGLAAGFLLVWLIAVSGRAVWIFSYADKAAGSSYLTILFTLFFPEIIFLILWFFLIETKYHYRILVFQYLQEDQLDLPPEQQFIPRGKLHLLRQHLWNGSFLSGIIRALKILLIPIGFTFLFFLFFGLGPNDRYPYQEFALTRAMMPEPAESYFFPSRIDSIADGKEISDQGRCLAEATFLGQVLGLLTFIVIWYIRFSKTELNREYPQGGSRGGSSFPFDDLRGGGMTN